MVTKYVPIPSKIAPSSLVVSIGLWSWTYTLYPQNMQFENTKFPYIKYYIICV